MPHPRYVLTFDANGGSEVEPMEEAAGTKITEFPVSTREGYDFLGWFTKKDGGSKVIGVTLNGSVTVYAHWEETSVFFGIKVFKLHFENNDIIKCAGCERIVFCRVCRQREEDCAVLPMVVPCMFYGMRQKSFFHDGRQVFRTCGVIQVKVFSMFHCNLNFPFGRLAQLCFCNS